MRVSAVTPSHLWCPRQLSPASEAGDPGDAADQQLVPPGWLPGARLASSPTSKLKKLRLKGKDYKKGGDGLRGKNVTEAYRVKEKDLKRTMK